MNLDLLIENLTNPALLFFLLGIFAVRVKSDLQIPENTSKFISLYLLMAIGFKGGQELAHGLNLEIIWSGLFGIATALIIPIYVFYLLKNKLGVSNAGAIASSYGSVSAVTFITTISFLELQHIDYGGHMVAVMAMMEAPAIIVGVFLMSLYKKSELHFKNIIKHSFTNSSVLMIIGSLIIGLIASEQHAEGIKPFTTDLFKGFLTVFLLDMGITSGKRIRSFLCNGITPLLFALLLPLINGILLTFLTPLVTDSIGNQLLLTILGASASYIAVPAAMRLAAPDANPSLYIPMSLGVTFPVNIIIGIPLYYYLLML